MVVKSGNKWLVKTEDGSKTLGEHATKEEADKQLAAIEASKARASHERGARLINFDSQKGSDGKVRSGVWDLLCLEGKDEKDGQSTEFSVETLSQFIENFEDRGDLLPYDHNHQTSYAAQNGKPAPALAWIGALACVWDGKIVKAGSAKGVEFDASEGIDLSKNGLYVYRSEVTDLGQDLIPQFKYLSPTFTTNGTTREGKDVGYSLIAAAFTNTPHQPGTSVTMSSNPSTDAKSVTNKGVVKMAKKLAKFAKLIGMEEGADEAAIKQALSAKMDEAAMASATDEKFDYEGQADLMEEMAKAYEESHMEEDEGEEPPHSMLRKMSAKFRKLSKMGEEPKEEAKMESEKKEKEEEEKKMAKLEADKKEEEKSEAKMATMQASLEATQAKLAKLQKAEDEREAAAQKVKQATFENLADEAIKGGYSKEQRDNLIKFASVDYKAAHAAVSHLLPKSTPANLFERATSMGAPIGGETSPRSFGAAPGPRVIESVMGKFIEEDGAYAEEIKRVAESKDPVLMAKVDQLLSEKKRPVLFERLMAAGKIVAAERPDLIK